ncbi:hypothetical protein DY000_02041222 [Brassica cretica]|uniref:Transcription factor MYC/MYB N-terminal domain-containing protein n=1 Tax=Brassica cretica TaxID=69181 RepID=A0ABQ7BCM2_BRACR|nr:hypothetical protein DY000_02041222 [Brassica cretica]
MCCTGIRSGSSKASGPGVHLVRQKTKFDQKVAERGLIGKVAADHSHKWIYKEPNDQEINFLSAWHNSADSYPRTWEAQFQSGIKTIALISVREGVVQLGSVHKLQQMQEMKLIIRLMDVLIPKL